MLRRSEQRPLPAGEKAAKMSNSLPLSLSPVRYWVWPARTGNSVNAAQSGRSALGSDAQ